METLTAEKTICVSASVHKFTMEPFLNEASDEKRTLSDCLD